MEWHPVLYTGKYLRELSSPPDPPAPPPHRPNPQATSDPTTALAWSPCGAYLFQGHASGTLRLWETTAWTSQAWAYGGSHSVHSARAGPGPSLVVAAAWAPARLSAQGLVLVAHAEAPGSLTALHMTGASAPSLEAQPMPVSLAWPAGV